jgi:hypothetical protein
MEVDMNWHKFKITIEQITSGEVQRIQEKFDQIWWPLSCPKGMAIYAEKCKGGPSDTYYLTPACDKYAKALIAYYAAVPCEQPDQASLIFLIGDSSFIS